MQSSTKTVVDGTCLEIIFQTLWSKNCFLFPDSAKALLLRETMPMLSSNSRCFCSNPVEVWFKCFFLQGNKCIFLHPHITPEELKGFFSNFQKTNTPKTANRPHSQKIGGGGGGGLQKLTVLRRGLNGNFSKHNYSECYELLARILVSQSKYST